MENEKKYLSIEDIEAYRIAFNLSNYVWNIILKWENFPKRTIGYQFIESIDSISANIAEGFGRYGKKDKIRFYRISQGSLSEALKWTKKAKIRNLLSDDEYRHLIIELDKLPKSINSLINFTNLKLKY